MDEANALCIPYRRLWGYIIHPLILANNNHHHHHHNASISIAQNKLSSVALTNK